MSAARLLLLASVAASLPATMEFSYRTSANPSPGIVADNGSIVFPPAAVGSSSTVTLIATNGTSGPVSLTGAALTGPEVLALRFSPAVLASGAATTLTITFTPSARGPVTAGLELRFSAPSVPAAFHFFLSANGQASDLAASYILLPDGNQLPVAAGGTIAFPPTPVKSASTATFVIANRGSAPGTVNAVSIGGEQFRISGLPLMPAAIAPEREMRFSVTYAPVVSGAAAGSLRVDLDGQQWSVALAGEGASAALLYELATAGEIVPIFAGSMVRLPDTTLGSTASGVVRVRNAGNLEARIGAIAVVGAPFRLADVPPLPVAVPPGGTISFALQFTPREAGAAAGTLLIDGLAIPLSGNGVGALLTLAWRVGSTVTPLPEGGSITFPNTGAGSASTVFVRITNAGNEPAAVHGISAGAPAFRLPAPPALPAAIAPGETLEFAVEFRPAAAGTASAALRIDDRTVTLRGTGDDPPPLPAVTIQLPETAAALDQPAVSLQLAEPYAADLTGTLTLSFLSESFGDDPNIQFSTGGRTIAFRIPANTTEAIFGQSARAVMFQAGTVAGTITVAASFQAGSTVVTPEPAPSRAVAVAAAPPVIRGVQAGARSAEHFELLISGLATTRSITHLNLEFTPAPGANLGTTAMTVDVEAPFAAWYGSAGGRSFGSQFTAALAIRVNGDPAAVQSVRVSAVNGRGASSPVSVALR